MKLNTNSVETVKALLKIELSKPSVDKAGDTVWRLPNGDIHRDYGPAIEFANGDRTWCKNGKSHREGGPAVEYASGYKAWYQNNERHCEDGPAVELADGSKQWWINGIKLSESEFNARIKTKAA